MVLEQHGGRLSVVEEGDEVDHGAVGSGTCVAEDVQLAAGDRGRVVLELGAAGKLELVEFVQGGQPRVPGLEVEFGESEVP